MFKGGWFIGLGQEWVVCMRVGGNCLKYLKRGWKSKEGRGGNNLKRGCKQSQGVGALKRGGWNTLTNYGKE